MGVEFTKHHHLLQVAQAHPRLGLLVVLALMM
jgi:hypothetical protein